MFFDQIKEVEQSIKQLQKDLIAIGEGVDGHYDQLDDIAAHVIALEAIMIEVMKKTEIDVDAVKAWIVAATEGSTGQKGGSTKAQIIVENLISGEPAPEKRDQLTRKLEQKTLAYLAGVFFAVKLTTFRICTTGAGIAAFLADQTGLAAFRTLTKSGIRGFKGILPGWQIDHLRLCQDLIFFQ